MSSAFDKVPWQAPEMEVLPEWIDYNGHMNVAYYTVAFDRSLDALLEVLDCGMQATKTRGTGPYALQSQYLYLNELLEGERFHCAFQLLDHDAKRLHLWGEITGPGGKLAAQFETLVMNVDLTARRSTAFHEEAAAQIARLAEAHGGLPRPERAGTVIGIRRG